MNHAVWTSNYKLFGHQMFNQLPSWARMLDWKEGKPPFDDAGHVKSPCVILFPTSDDKVACIIVGDENEMGGVCNCCTNGYQWSDKSQHVFAHTLLEFPTLEKPDDSTPS